MGVPVTQGAEQIIVNGTQTSDHNIDQNGQAQDIQTAVAGNLTITVNYQPGPGNNFAPSTATLTRVVADPTQPTQTTVSVSPDPPIAGQPYTITATTTTMP